MTLRLNRNRALALCPDKVPKKRIERTSQLPELVWQWLSGHVMVDEYYEIKHSC